MKTSKIVFVSEEGVIADTIKSLLIKEFELVHLVYASSKQESLIYPNKEILLKGDLILLNLASTTIDFEDLITHLSDTYSSIPLIVLHHYKEKVFADAFLKMGASAYLPINLIDEQLTTTLNEVMKKSS